MDKMIRDLYAQARAKGYDARTSLRIAKFEPEIELEWQDYDSRATFTRDGFTFRVRVEPDDDTDLSWIGEFQNHYEDGAIRNPNFGYVRHVYEWFVPTYTYEERVRDLRKSGRARGVAHEEARAAIRRDAELATDYQEYVIALHVEREDVKLATAYLGGVGFSDDYNENRRYVADVVADLLDEAIEEARETLARLCG